ncbi:Na+/H+ antiporter NhaC family protein [Salinilacihabitans rarus]|uniref:Na+/H+ antiporter NhaC family protein n=1 Tax=Salinilacihabitans rarus TaxID=2961596 RepID=UPI0020C8DC85|nr:Na+/H+ antiporter NhaC family protein [Salinilacihabitans rarus]
MASDFGALSLVPPLLAIVLAIVTRRALLSLFIGIWVGGTLFVARGAAGIVDVVTLPLAGGVQAFDWIIGSIADDFNAQIILFTMLIGAGIALIWRMGGSIAVANYATSRIDSHRKVGLGAWALGLFWFFDDYANTAIVGSAMKDIADEMNMSREKLSYILDSTAAPVATFGISSWVAFQISLIDNELPSLDGETPGAVATFLRSIPFNVYCLLAIVMVLLIVLTRRDFGEMLDAETRARTTGKVNRDGAKPLQSMKDDLGELASDDPRLRSFVLPVAMLVLVVVSGALYTGLSAIDAGLAEVFADSDALITLVDSMDFTGALVWGSFTMVATGVVLALYDDIMDLREAMETVIDGFAIMLNAVSILVMAWSIGTVAGELGTGEYVTGIAEGVVTPALLPVVILLSAALISFSIGTSWGTMGIVTPIAVPMAWTIGGQSPELLAVAVGAVFSGAIFGDHCSPISDTTILSSTFAGADHIDHVRTQIYYAMTVMFVAILVYLVYGFLGLPPLVLVPLGVAILAGLVYGLSELDATRKGVSSRPFAERPAGEPASDD